MPYQDVVAAVAFIQMVLLTPTIFRAIIKDNGMGRYAGMLIAGSLIGVTAYYLCQRWWGYDGALAGLALVPALIIIPALPYCRAAAISAF